MWPSWNYARGMCAFIWSNQETLRALLSLVVGQGPKGMPPMPREDNEKKRETLHKKRG